MFFGELGERSKQSHISPYLFAVVYVGLGDKEAGPRVAGKKHFKTARFF